MGERGAPREEVQLRGSQLNTIAPTQHGPLGLDLLTGDVDSEGLSTLAELTLALLLFADAANANLGELKRFSGIPMRLLLIGLPLTILLGFGAGVILFSGLTLLEIALLATMLAPTDAALGKAVVTNETVPSNIRESLNSALQRVDALERVQKANVKTIHELVGQVAELEEEQEGIEMRLDGAQRDEEEGP